MQALVYIFCIFVTGLQVLSFEASENPSSATVRIAGCLGNARHFYAAIEQERLQEILTKMFILRWQKKWIEEKPSLSWSKHNLWLWCVETFSSSRIYPSASMDAIRQRFSKVESLRKSCLNMYV